MKKHLRKSIGGLLVLIMLLGSTTMVSAAKGVNIEPVIADTAAYIYAAVKNPQVGSIGGEWAVMGLARSEYEVPKEYYHNYYVMVANHITACGGVLDTRKLTEYSRLIVALTAIGKDPANVAGYNLLTALGDYDRIIWQGINGPIWALIALDSGNYVISANSDVKTPATRQMYVDFILNRQLADGGFSLSGYGHADPGLTGMAIQALARYTHRNDVAEAIEKALACLSAMQDDQGRFPSYSTPNSEDCAQVIVALCALNIPLDDSRFMKNGQTALDGLLSFYINGRGFKHIADGNGANQMATEQSFYALVAAQRANSGKNSLYEMSDPIAIGEADQKASVGDSGLHGRNTDVKAVPIVYPGKAFGDVNGHINQGAIDALAARGILNGYDDGTFRPDNYVTRAEFAAIVVAGLGLQPQAANIFSDISPGSWYAPCVGTAYTYGIIKGVGNNRFNPEGLITRQEAVVMIAGAAKLCGMDTFRNSQQIRDTMAQFGDYIYVADWAQSAMAFCYHENILSQSDLNIAPAQDMSRCEIAQMLHNMLVSAKLL